MFSNVLLQGLGNATKTEVNFACGKQSTFDFRGKISERTTTEILLFDVVVFLTKPPVRGSLMCTSKLPDVTSEKLGASAQNYCRFYLFQGHPGNTIGNATKYEIQYFST